MKRSKFSEAQIGYAIRQADALVGDLRRQLGVNAATFDALKNKYAYLGISELRRLRQLEEENSRLKRLVADLSLDKRMLFGDLRKKSKARPPSRTGRLGRHLLHITCCWPCASLVDLCCARKADTSASTAAPVSATPLSVAHRSAYLAARSVHLDCSGP